VAEDQSGYRPSYLSFQSLRVGCHCNQFYRQNCRNQLSYLHSSPRHSETDWNIGILIAKGSMAMIDRYTSCETFGEFGPVTREGVHPSSISSLATLARRRHC